MYFGFPPNFPSIRVNSSPAGGSSGDSAVVHESPHHPQTTHDGLSRPSSDEGENEEREDNAEKLDCLYSGYHPRPAAVSVLSCPQLLNSSDRLYTVFLIPSVLLFPVLYLWKSTIRERLLLLWQAVEQSAMCPNHDDGKACQLSDVEVCLSISSPLHWLCSKKIHKIFSWWDSCKTSLSC